MAKQIKAIQCPNCGSVNKIEIKPDFYRCESCQTEYFLDNDDVNINYNHNYNNSDSDSKKLKRPFVIIGFVFAFIILATILNSFFKSPINQSSTDPTYSAPVIEKKKDDQSFYTRRHNNYPFLQPSSQKPFVIMLETRGYNNPKYKSKDGTYLDIYDPINKKLLSEENLNEKGLSSSDFKFRTFSDGHIYMVNNKTTLFKFDKETLKIENIGNKFFEVNNELEIGVATLEFVNEERGDGLILLTNDGKKRYYYPLIQKLYTEEEFYKAYAGFKTLLPNSKEKTIHVFTSKSLEFPEDKIQLIKVTYKDNGPGPKDAPTTMSWGKDYGRSGIFTGNDPYKKLLINAYQKEAKRVLKLGDLTPDRLYFGASVLLDDGEVLIIQFRANANTASDYKFQKIDRETGAVIWTAELPDGKRFENMIRYKDGLLGINSNDDMILLDEEGKVTSNYKLE